MDNVVKQRVIGAVVLVALAVIFVPMLLNQSGDNLGPVGGNLPDQPEQIVHDRIEPLTLPEPPAETEPAQVVLDQPTPENAAAAPAPAIGAPQSETPQPGTSQAGTPPATPSPAPNPTANPPLNQAPNASVAEETVTAPPPAVPTPAAPVATPATPAPAAVEKPAPAPAKALSGWVVQLVATANKTHALALREKLRALGYTAFVEETKTAQGVLFRVRVGPELERGNAEDVRNRLERQVRIKGMVTRYP